MTSRAHLYAPPPLRSLRMPILIFAAVGSIVLLAAVYHVGRVHGSAGARAAERAAQLRTNQAELAALAPRLQEAQRAKIVAAARVPVAEKHYQAARSRISIADSAHVSIDSGPALELPPPVISAIAAADTLVPELRAQVIAERAWGEVWHDKAVLLEQRVGILEAERKEQRSATRVAIAKAAAIGAAMGALVVEVIR